MFSLMAGAIVAASCVFALGYWMGWRGRDRNKVRNLINKELATRLAEREEHAFIYGDGVKVVRVDPYEGATSFNPRAFIAVKPLGTP